MFKKIMVSHLIDVVVFFVKLILAKMKTAVITKKVESQKKELEDVKQKSNSAVSDFEQSYELYKRSKKGDSTKTD